MAENSTGDALKIPIEVANQDSVVYTNIGQEYIVTTVDKVELCLTRHKNSLEDKRKWLVPLCAFISVMPVIVTSKFVTRFGVEAPVWQGIIYTLAGFLLLWALSWGCTAIRSPNLNDIISELKKAKGEHREEGKAEDLENKEVLF